MSIGGYQQFDDVPGNGDLVHAPSCAVQSARAAFALYLQARKPATIWMPGYCCEALKDSAASARIPVRWYAINEELGIDRIPELDRDDLLVYVNYFGVCDRHIEQLLREIPKDQLLVDNAQALLARAHPGVATIYSPRKFVGVPDGGLLVSELAISEPPPDEHASLRRLQHLAYRSGNNVTAGYPYFREAEESLEDLRPRGMSAISRILLSRIDFAAHSAARKRNFSVLHQRLGSCNELAGMLDIGAELTPLCYPFLPKTPISKADLAQARIYVPSYWPSVMLSADPGSLEYKLSANLLALPCDQRLSPADMELVADAVKSRL